MGNLRILIAEGDEFYADSLRRVMERGGHRVIGVADHAAQALSLAAAQHPDLALIDVNLRDGCSGVDLGRRLAREHVRVLFVTGVPERAPVNEPGIVGAIAKPAGDAALLDAVGRIDRARPRERGSRSLEPERGSDDPKRRLPDLLSGLIERLRADVRALVEPEGTAEWAVVVRTRVADIAALTALSADATRAARHVAAAANRVLRIGAESARAETGPDAERALHANALEDAVAELRAAAEAFITGAASCADTATG